VKYLTVGCFTLGYLVLGCEGARESGPDAAASGNFSATSGGPSASGNAGNGDAGAGGSTVAAGASGAAGDRSGAGGAESMGGGGGASGTAGDAGSCQENPPCGGDLVGSWTIIGSCMTELVGTASCPELVADARQYQQRGTVTYSANGSYTSTVTSSGTLGVTYPAACLFTLSCKEYELALSSSLPPGYELNGCAEGAAGSCACSYDIDTAPMTASGAYTVSNGVLTQQSSAGTVTSDYCVTANQLRLTSRNGSGQVAQTFLLQR